MCLWVHFVDSFDGRGEKNTIGEFELSLGQLLVSMCVYKEGGEEWERKVWVSRDKAEVVC